MAKRIQAQREVYSLSELAVAIERAPKRPPALIPKTAFGGPRQNRVPSRKARELDDDSFSSVHCVQGRLEATFAIHTEMNPSVRQLIAQPFWINFEGYNGLNLFLPDFIVYPHNATPYFVDVKNQDALLSPKHGTTAIDRRDALAEHRYQLIHPTETDLLVEPRYSSTKRLYSMLRGPKGPLVRAAHEVLITLTNNLGGSARLFELLPYLSVTTIQTGIAYGLFKGQLTTDHEMPFGEHFLVQTREEAQC